jgi:hypothetical protein
MMFVEPKTTSMLKSDDVPEVLVLKKQENQTTRNRAAMDLDDLQQQVEHDVDVSTTAFCSDSESTDADEEASCLVESILGTKQQVQQQVQGQGQQGQGQVQAISSLEVLASTSSSSPDDDADDDDAQIAAADAVFASVFASVSASAAPTAAGHRTQPSQRTPPPPPPPQEKSNKEENKKQKKRARFALGHTQIVYVATLANISASERADCWWGAKDYQAFRCAAKHAACEARNNNNNNSNYSNNDIDQGGGGTGGCGSCVEVGVSVGNQAVDDGYPTATKLACTMQEHEMERALAEYKIVKLTQGLKAWACRSVSCRGLEHWTSRKYFEARIDAMEEARNIVLSMSMQLVHDQQQHSKESGGVHEEIARHYQATSRPARILARLRGHADYEAAVVVSV